MCWILVCSVIETVVHEIYDVKWQPEAMLPRLIN